MIKIFRGTRGFPLAYEGCQKMAKDQSHYNRIAAIFFLLVGIFFALYARTVEIGSWHEPGPGFLPFWAGLILGAMALALLFGSYARKAWPVRPSFFARTDSWKRVLATFLALIAYNLLLPYLGFTATTFLFLTFLVRFIFPQTWRRTLLVSVLGSVVARLLFINFLETQLPKGFLGF
jgi:putative tricarboxylic transport membrane protein